MKETLDIGQKLGRSDESKPSRLKAGNTRDPLLQGRENDLGKEVVNELPAPGR